jgi:predicted HAD superfamily Cof-like phosphohydrolase
MSEDWVRDIAGMHRYYGVNEKVQEFDDVKLKQFLQFRMSFLMEELEETKNAVKNNDAEEIVDGLIDLCVVAIGTLDSMGIDSYEAWNRVLRANLQKQVGVKPERPNPLGLPDLIKPAGWKAPSHAKNHGLLTKLKK